MLRSPGTPNDYQISYVVEKATTGRNTIRRSEITLPGGMQVRFKYLSTGSLHDDDASRITRVQGYTGGSVTIAQYDYVGLGQVVGIDYPENEVMWLQYGTSGSYPDLDRFNRVTSSRWTKDLATDRDFYDIDIAYDRNSNITLIEDNVQVGFDVGYTIDGLDRLTMAEEGTWNSGTSQIDSMTREQIWDKLTQTGNWERVKLDLDGDANYSDTGEYDDLRSHNDVNELTARNTDATGGDEFTLAYDAVGNLTDDGEHYEYVWDVFGRLREVLDTTDQSLVAEYRYSGLGHRIGWHYDVDGDGTVEDTSDDPWFFFVYDERWRIVATYRDDDGDPKEQFVHHNAGPDGMGSSSYIDTLIRHPVDSGCRAPFDLEERVSKPPNGEVVEERTESLFPLPERSMSHTVQRTWHAAIPALRPGRVMLIRVLLGQAPSLHHLRRGRVRFVRQLRRYYEPVRLPVSVHRWIAVFDLPSASPGAIFRGRIRDLPVLAHGVSTRAGGLRPRRVIHALAFSRAGVLPSAQDNGVGTLCAPVFAAQYSARVCPCQRFTCPLAGAGA